MATVVLIHEAAEVLVILNAIRAARTQSLPGVPQRRSAAAASHHVTLPAPPPPVDACCPPATSPLKMVPAQRSTCGEDCTCCRTVEPEKSRDESMHSPK